MKEEKVYIPSNEIRLEGSIQEARSFRGGVIGCHPHPQYGGDMTHPVVTTALEAAFQEGFSTLRFNFRGVGETDGSYGDGIGKHVAMVGGGNSAVTEALHLFHMGVKVTVIHRRDTLRAQEFLVRQLNDNQISVLWNTEVQEIRGEDRVKEILLFNNSTQQASTLPVDGVFIAIGYEPAVELAQKMGLEITEDGYIKQDGRHRTSRPGIYSAGDVEGGYKQIVTASGQGAEAAMAIFEDLINPYWLHAK